LRRGGKVGHPAGGGEYLRWKKGKRRGHEKKKKGKRDRGVKEKHFQNKNKNKKKKKTTMFSKTEEFAERGTPTIGKKKKN